VKHLKSKNVKRAKKSLFIEQRLLSFDRNSMFRFRNNKAGSKLFLLIFKAKKT